MASGEPVENLTKNKHLYLFEVLLKSVDIKEKFLNESERETIFKNVLKVRVIFSDFYDVEINEVKDIKSIHLPPQPDQVKCHSKMTKMFNTSETAKGKDDKLNSTKNDSQQMDFIRKSSEHSRRAGFSCLFPMNPEELMNKLKTSYLYLMVYGNCGVDSDGVEVQKIIGQAKVSIRSNFIDSVQYAIGIDEFPTTASLATTCTVRNSFEEKTGKVEIYVRLSCFGKYIISIFNMMKNNPQTNVNNNNSKVTQLTDQTNCKLKKKSIKQKNLTKTASSKLIKNKNTSQSSNNLNVSPQSINNQSLLSQPVINQTASLETSVNISATSRPSKNLSASSRPTINQTASLETSMNQSATSRPSKNLSASSRPSINQTASLETSMNLSATSRPSKNLSASSRSTINPTASLETPMNHSASSRPSKNQSATSRPIINQTASLEASINQNASSRPSKNQSAPSHPTKNQTVSP